MLEPDVTLTDYALALECAGFAVLLYSRLRAGAGGRISALFVALFATLSASSVLGASYHGFYSAAPSARGEALWLLTLLAIGLVAFFAWLVAAEIQLSRSGRRVVMALAALETLGYAIYVITISRDFRIASINSGVAMIFLMAGYGRQLRRGAGRRAWLGLFGLVLAFSGAVLQQMEIGLHPDYFNYNALYHLFQFVAFALVFASIPALERRGVAGSPGPSNRTSASSRSRKPELLTGRNR